MKMKIFTKEKSDQNTDWCTIHNNDFSNEDR